MKSNFKHDIPASARLPKTILIGLAACFYFNGTAALAGAGDDLVNAISAQITESNREQRVTKALAAGAPVDYIANPAANKTPLIDASYYCRAGVAKILVDKGANVNHRNNVNKTALDYALQKKCWPIAALILKTGKVSDAKAIVNSVNHESNTYLHFAARDGDNQAVRLLLDAGADPNAIGYANSTPLHFAAGGNGNSDTVRLLVEAGALIRLRNASGKSPEELANTFGNMNVAGRLNYLDQQLQKNKGNPAATVATTKTPSNPAAPAPVATPVKPAPTPPVAAATMPRELSVLDPTWYVNKYPDLKAAFGGNVQQAQNHWLSFGIKEGRDSGPNFSISGYLQRYPDLQKAFGKNYAAALNHWLTFGIKEGRDPRSVSK